MQLFLPLTTEFKEEILKLEGKLEGYEEKEVKAKERKKQHERDRKRRRQEQKQKEEEMRIDEERQRRSVHIRMDKEERIIREREKRAFWFNYIWQLQTHTHTHTRKLPQIYNMLKFKWKIDNDFNYQKIVAACKEYLQTTHVVLIVLQSSLEGVMHVFIYKWYIHVVVASIALYCKQTSTPCLTLELISNSIQCMFPGEGNIFSFEVVLFSYSQCCYS